MALDTDLQGSAAIVAVVTPEGPTRRRVLRALGSGRVVLHADAEELLADGDSSLQAIVLDCPEDDALAPLLEAVVEAFPLAALVVLAGDPDGRVVRRALASGATGVLRREALETALDPCLRAALAGQVCVPREHRRELRPPVLSTREKQILGLVVMGYMNSQIAERLFLAESTVKSHLHSAFGKLGVRSRNEAVSLILDPARGLGIGILGVGAEPLATLPGGT
jgi:DNA-binding NarL/FixJ family response regulator